jgi:hypothetical protein
MGEEATMKRLIIILSVFFFLASCSEDWYREGFEYRVLMGGYKVETLWDVLDWVSSNLVYCYGGYTHELKIPREIIEEKKGICIHFTILAGYMCLELGIKNVKYMSLRSKEEFDGRRYGHAVIKVDGILYEPQASSKRNQDREYLEVWFDMWEVNLEIDMWKLLYYIVYEAGSFDKSYDPNNCCAELDEDSEIVEVESPNPNIYWTELDEENLKKIMCYIKENFIQGMTSSELEDLRKEVEELINIIEKAYFPPTPPLEFMGFIDGE